VNSDAVVLRVSPAVDSDAQARDTGVRMHLESLDVRKMLREHSASPMTLPGGCSTLYREIFEDDKFDDFFNLVDEDV
jgi:hypothetical protein